MTKITAEHLARRACVYIRQSTADQLAHNHESRRRQYGLVDRAKQLGWSNVDVIDDDLGRSGGGIARPRFERLLATICDSRDKRITSTWLGSDDGNGEPSPLLMHPEDARARGLDGAKSVRVWNDLGSVILPLRITDAVRRGVVASEKGAWLATSETGTTINALVSADDKADLAKGACYNDTRVEVELA